MLPLSVTVALLLVGTSSLEPSRVAPEDTPACAGAVLRDARLLPELEEEAVVVPRSFLIPAVETVIFEAGLHLYDRYVLDAAFAQVTAEDVGRNLQGGWRLDADDIFVNSIGHTYQGAVVYGTARSSGLTFGESLPYTVGGALAWELAAEMQSPSINDLLYSGVNGAILGEALHRLALLFVNGDPSPPLLPWLASFVLEPWGTVNRMVFGRRAPASELPLTHPWRAYPFGGLLLIDGDQLHLRSQGSAGMDLTYGFPSGGGTDCLEPVEHFEANGFLGMGEGARSLDFFLRSLLVGCRYGDMEQGGAWGLFSLTDFVTGPGFRLADLAFGPGTAVEQRVRGGRRLRISVVAAGVVLGASGEQELTDVDLKSTEPDVPALYPAQMGFQGLADVEYLMKNGGALRMVGRIWQLTNVTTESGNVTASLVTLAATGPPFARVAPQLRFSWRFRRGEIGFPGDRGWLAMMLLGVPLSGDHGRGIGR